VSRPLEEEGCFQICGFHRTDKASYSQRCDGKVILPKSIAGYGVRLQAAWKIKAIVEKPIKDVGELDFEDSF
jgi:hypothetical protein